MAAGDQRTSAGATSRRPRSPLWVYGRAGRPCLRCSTLVEVRRHGELPRADLLVPRLPGGSCGSSRRAYADPAPRDGGRWRRGRPRGLRRRPSPHRSTSPSRRPTAPRPGTRRIGPPIRLPLAQLYQLSIYWFGINAIWGGLNIVTPGADPAPRAARRGGSVSRLPRHLRGHRRGRRPADGRLDQRLHDQPLGPSQAVHRDRVRARRRLPDRDRDVADLPRRSSRSWCCCSSARISPRARSRAICPTSCRRRRSASRARSSA